jgi:glycosyltransferase involved in cell wall biosynthesis
MRIAFFHELHFGGARRVVYEYAKAYSQDHEVDLYYVNDHKEKEVDSIFSSSKLFLFKFNLYLGDNFVLKLYKDFVEPIKLYFLHKKIAKIIDQGNYDFIFVHGSQFTHAPFILRFLKTPTAYFCQEPLRTAHDPVVISELNNLPLLKKIYEKLIRESRRIIDSSNIKSADLVLSNCQYSNANIKKAYGIRSYVCYLGVDPKLFKPRNLKKKYDILFVGDPIKMEGYDTFTDTVKLFKQPIKTYIVKSEQGKHMSDVMLAKKYCETKVVCVLGRFDPFSMIPWEAMSSEVPPVVINEGGPIEAVEDGITGLLVTRDPSKIKAAVQKLINNDTLRSDMGKQGRNSVIAKWNWDASSMRAMNLIKKELLNARN